MHTTQLHTWHCRSCPTTLRAEAVDDLLDAISVHKAHCTPRPVENPVGGMRVAAAAVLCLVVAFVFAVLLLVVI